MQSGIVISSGAVKRISRKNLKNNTSSINLRRGSSKLQQIAHAKTKDAAIIKLIFIPKEEYISFNFVFGSEEYPEYVRSPFNDAFGFFLKTPGQQTTNLALIPDSNHRIAINSVNHLKNACYYVNNTTIANTTVTATSDTSYFWKSLNQYKVVTTYNISRAIISNPGIPIEFDGFTKLIQAKSKVVPGKKHRLEICIADASDRIYDSGVLIEAGSFSANTSDDFKFGALASDTNYYFRRDTTLFYSPPPIEEIPLPEIDTQLVIHYDVNQSILNEKEQAQIRSFLTSIPKGQKYILTIESYTDQDGSDQYNLQLSAKRAKAIKSFLSSVVSENIIIEQSKGLGEHPLLSSDKSEKRISLLSIKSTSVSIE
jgi:outer membrane protein OmpA-like peptidoglycan-associated protein